MARFVHTPLLAAFATSALFPPIASAQSATQHVGWHTVRNASQCVTGQEAGSVYETLLIALVGAANSEALAIRVPKGKYPYLKQATGRDIEVPIIIGNGNDIVHRLRIKTKVLDAGTNLDLVFDDELFPYLENTTRLHIQFPSDISQNINVNYGNFSTALADLRQCERIRSGLARPASQKVDPSIDDLPPFERAKKWCEKETLQTGGLVAADNPYVLDGRRYPNACEAVADAVLRKVRKVER